ncbi:MAG: HNH endonuclease [Planctomycetia bacterium]|nr:HNH endonuclease [Planctomycetia bacterium]
MKLRERLYRHYATLGMAVYSLKNGNKTYTPIAYGIRKKFLKQLLEGTSKVKSIFKDEKMKMDLPDACCYCGVVGKLTLDHVVPRIRGGWDSGDNLVFACARCNSDKKGDDLVVWYNRRNQFPPIYILQRYLKLAMQYCDENGLMEEEEENLNWEDFPFSLREIPDEFPQPSELVLSVPPQKTEEQKIFEGTCHVFTGDLYGLTREEARNLVKAGGGETRLEVSSHVTHLVVGQQLWEEYKKGKTTNKIRATQNLQQKGIPIKIIPEIAFLTKIVKK